MSLTFFKNMGKGSSKIAAPAESTQSLDLSELDTVPKDLREKILKEYERCKEDSEELRSKYDHLKVDLGEYSPTILPAILSFSHLPFSIFLRH